MRAKLTLDDDLAKRLKEIAGQEGRSYGDVTNEVIRQGLGAGVSRVAGVRPFQVASKSCGLKPGFDPLKLKRIHDDLEIEGLGSKADRGVHGK